MAERARGDAGTPDGARARKGRLTLVLIACAALAPLVAAYTFYYLLPRSASTNYGTLLSVAPAPAIEGTRADGSAFRLDELHGKWVVVATSGAKCDASCERMLYATRQARTMQGKDQDRVVRAWLVVGDDAPAQILVAQHPGLIVAHVSARALASFPGGVSSVYIVDPLGNLVLQYPQDPDIKGLARDLSRLLLASQIG
jgi:hypothetical protein